MATKAYKDRDELLSTDWQSKINSATSDAERAMYEQARNDKIASQEYKDRGGKQTQTHIYTPPHTVSPTYNGGNKKSAVGKNDYLSSSNGDYSLAIKRAQDNGADPWIISQLQAERSAKIEAMYGGRDPYKGTSNIMAAPGQTGNYESPPVDSLLKKSKYSPGWYIERDPRFANRRIAIGEWTYIFNDKGGNIGKVRDGGASANSVLPVDPAMINRSQAHRDAYEAAARGDWDAVGNALNQISQNGGINKTYGTYDMTEANAYNEYLQAAFNPSIKNYYRHEYDKVYGQGAWDDPNHTFGNQVIDPFYSNLVQQSQANGGWLPSAPIGSEAGGSIRPGKGGTIIADNPMNLENILSSMNGSRNPGFFVPGEAPSGGFPGGGFPGGGFPGGGSFNGMGGMPEYGGSEWDQIYEDAVNKLLGMNYENWTGSDQYKALAKRYGNEGKLAMQDVLGQMASRTGGLASSYAGSAAQQTENSFLSELEKVAREMFERERGELRENAEMAHAHSAEDYDRFLDSLRAWEANRRFEYEQSRDAEEDRRYQESLDRTAAENKAQELAAYGDFSGFKALGYTDAEIAAMQQAYRDQMAQKQPTHSSSGGGSRGGGSTEAKPRLTASQTLAALKDGRVNDSTLAAYRYWFGEDWRGGGKDEDDGGGGGFQGKYESSAPYEPFSMSKFRHLLHTDQDAAMEYANMHMDNMSEEDYKEVSHFLN